MSIENVRKFYEALKDNTALVDELKTASEELNREVAQKAFEMLADFAQKKGYDVTVEDIKAYESKAQELSDDELDQINAAASLCFLIGVGWGDTNWTRCRVVGAGISDVL